MGSIRLTYSSKAANAALFVSLLPPIITRKSSNHVRNQGYDYLLTFSQEVRYIHKMPFTPVTVLFLLARYLPVADIALVIVCRSKF